ncbi:hypothetical protein CAEBREN_17926 [Caenorhabditis brenneri]|uniref:Uncharacterized protein n=1 Tax=Caenorhabditis brenneri TaxID=135651 RepID=G0NK95_CAEBE|nr:hypothetical protein CAEBREN_17926 [Caenorhabditis brenneri]
MCESKNVDVTSAQLEDVRNGFVYYIFQSAVELLPCIFSINVFLYPGRLSSYRAAEFSMSKNFPKITDWYSKPPRLRSIYTNSLYRKNKAATLWLLIPCELKHHLLEHVLEYGLMELLPKEARSFLSRWIIDVRKRMRKRLTKGDLRNKIEQYMSAVVKNEWLSPDDARIEGVISAVLENALNSKDFKVFDGEWKNFTLNLIKTMDRHQFVDISSRADILREVCQNMHPASLQRLSSCFSNSETDKTLLSHTLHQVLHFTIRFALSTLRHVFRIDRQLRIRFDGYMEEVVTDFSDYSRSTSPEIDFVVVPNSEDTPQSSECQKPLPTIQVIRPRKTLLPTPVHQSPLASHLDDFYQRMPPSDYKVSPIQNTCSIYSARGPVLFDAQQFEPRSAQHLEGDGKKSFFSFSSGVNTTKQPKAESFNDSSLSEEKKVEVPKAKALRQPSVSSFTQIDDFEGLPDEWVIEYKAALDTNTKLLAELDRAKARLDAILK